MGSKTVIICDLCGAKTSNSYPGGWRHFRITEYETVTSGERGRLRGVACSVCSDKHVDQSMNSLFKSLFRKVFPERP